MESKGKNIYHIIGNIREEYQNDKPDTESNEIYEYILDKDISHILPKLGSNTDSDYGDISVTSHATSENIGKHSDGIFQNTFLNCEVRKYTHGKQERNEKEELDHKLCTISDGSLETSVYDNNKIIGRPELESRKTYLKDLYPEYIVIVAPKSPYKKLCCKIALVCVIVCIFVAVSVGMLLLLFHFFRFGGTSDDVFNHSNVSSNVTTLTMQSSVETTAGFYQMFNSTTISKLYVDNNESFINDRKSPKINNVQITQKYRRAIHRMKYSQITHKYPRINHRKKIIASRKLILNSSQEIQEVKGVLKIKDGLNFNLKETIHVEDAVRLYRYSAKLYTLQKRGFVVTDLKLKKKQGIYTASWLHMNSRFFALQVNRSGEILVLDDHIGMYEYHTSTGKRSKPVITTGTTQQPTRKRKESVWTLGKTQPYCDFRSHGNTVYVLRMVPYRVEIYARAREKRIRLLKTSQMTVQQTTAGSRKDRLVVTHNRLYVTSVKKQQLYIFHHSGKLLQQIDWKSIQKIVPVIDKNAILCRLNKKSVILIVDAGNGTLMINVANRGYWREIHLLGLPSMSSPYVIQDVVMGEYWRHMWVLGYYKLDKTRKLSKTFYFRN